MVQAVENLTLIDGRIVGRTPHPSLPDYDIVTVDLERTEEVPGKANMLESMRGKPVGVAVRRALLADAAAGMRLRCRAKRTLDGAMCETDPAQGDFAVEP